MPSKPPTLRTSKPHRPSGHPSQEAIWNLREIAWHMRIPIGVLRVWHAELNFPMFKMPNTRWFTTRTAIARWVEIQCQIDSSLLPNEKNSPDDSSLGIESPSPTSYPLSLDLHQMKKGLEPGHMNILTDGEASYSNWPSSPDTPTVPNTPRFMPTSQRCPTRKSKKEWEFY